MFVVSPWGLAGPYTVTHGGAQGDSMGVGTYSAAGVIRTRFNRGVISAGLSPSTLGPSHPPSAALFPSLPWLPHEIVPEVVFSDDRSLFAKSLAGLDYILEANCQSSWSGGGAFHLTYSPTGPEY